MSLTFDVPGLDVYVGVGVSYDQLRSALISVFDILGGAIIPYDSDEAIEAPKFQRWALVHEVKDNSVFAFKVDIEMNGVFDWLPALRKMAVDLGVLVSCPDESSRGDGMLCVYPDGTVDMKYFDPDDCGAS